MRNGASDSLYNGEDLTATQIFKLYKQQLEEELRPLFEDEECKKCYYECKKIVEKAEKIYKKNGVHGLVNSKDSNMKMFADAIESGNGESLAI